MHSPPIALIPQVIRRIREQGQGSIGSTHWFYLPTVLRALKGSPFEPLQSTNLRSLSLKTALLLALASVKQVGDLQAISISPACLEFGPNDSKVVLKPRHGYVPKVLSTPFKAQVITHSTLLPSEEDQELSLLCPVRALRIFVSFGNRAKGHPVTKQRLSKWIVVMLAYSSFGLKCPIEVRAHSTRGIPSSWAWSSGVSITEICRSSRPSITSMSLAGFSPEYTTHIPMGIKCLWRYIMHRSSTLARRD